MNTTICINELKNQYDKANEERNRILGKICDQLADFLDDLPVVDCDNDAVKVRFTVNDAGDIEIDLSPAY